MADCFALLSNWQVVLAIAGVETVPFEKVAIDSAIFLRQVLQFPLEDRGVLTPLIYEEPA